MWWRLFSINIRIIGSHIKVDKYKANSETREKFVENRKVNRRANHLRVGKGRAGRRERGRTAISEMSLNLHGNREKRQLCSMSHDKYSVNGGYHKII